MIELNSDKNLATSLQGLTNTELTLISGGEWLCCCADPRNINYMYNNGIMASKNTCAYFCQRKGSHIVRCL